MNKIDLGRYAELKRKMLEVVSEIEELEKKAEKEGLCFRSVNGSEWILAALPERAQKVTGFEDLHTKDIKKEGETADLELEKPEKEAPQYYNMDRVRYNTRSGGQCNPWGEMWYND